MRIREKFIEKIALNLVLRMTKRLWEWNRDRQGTCGTREDMQMQRCKRKHVVTEEERLESFSVNSTNISAAPFQAKTLSVYILDSPPQNQILSNRNLSSTDQLKNRFTPITFSEG